MKISKLIIAGVLAFCALPVALLAYDYGRYDASAVNVSLLQLLGNPDKYSKKTVRVIGVYFWSAEGSYLFLTQDHYMAYDITTAVELPVRGDKLPASQEKMLKLNGSLVAIEGVVDIENHGSDPNVGIMPIHRIFSHHLLPGKEFLAPSPKKP